MHHAGRGTGGRGLKAVAYDGHGPDLVALPTLSAKIVWLGDAAERE